ncbi:MAG: response regulator, partial [bacterium]|nr:response regulator [bacterium]
LMGSELQVESEAERGTQFWFDVKLPIVLMEPEPAHTDTRSVTGYTGERRTILVVDDKMYNRSVIVDMLEPLGFRCLEAVNGRELVDKACEIRPDLILTDLVMPVMTGFEAVQEIRQIPNVRDTPVIAMTASVFEMDQEQSRLAGCDAFLPKPVDMQKLFTLIQTYMNLEWLYETPDEKPAVAEPTAGSTPASPLTLPPPEELEVLRELAIVGDLFSVQERAAALEHQDSKYTAFADTLYHMAKNYQDKQLLVFLKQVMEGSQ